MTLSGEITGFLQARETDLVGFTGLRILTASLRRNLPRAVGFRVAFAPEIVAGIKERPTKEYHAGYERVNSLIGRRS